MTPAGSNNNTKTMTFSDVVRAVLRDHPGGLTPQQVRDIVKTRYPEHYDTESNRRNVERGTTLTSITPCSRASMCYLDPAPIFQWIGRASRS